MCIIQITTLTAQQMKQGMDKREKKNLNKKTEYSKIEQDR